MVEVIKLFIMRFFLVLLFIFLCTKSYSQKKGRYVHDEYDVRSIYIKKDGLFSYIPHFALCRDYKLVHGKIILNRDTLVLTSRYKGYKRKLNHTQEFSNHLHDSILIRIVNQDEKMHIVESIQLDETIIPLVDNAGLGYDVDSTLELKIPYTKPLEYLILDVDRKTLPPVLLTSKSNIITVYLRKIKNYQRQSIAFREKFLIKGDTLFELNNLYPNGANFILKKESN